MRQVKEEREVKVKLTREGIFTISKQSSILADEISKLKRDAKQLAAKLKTEIENKETLLADLLRCVQDETQTRIERVIDMYNIVDGVVITLLERTHEEVSRRTMNQDERQSAFSFGEA